MKRLQAYQFQLKTTPGMDSRMRQFSGSCRFVWNKALALQQERYQAEGTRINYNDLAGLLVAWKKDSETSFLAGVHSQILQQTLKDLERAWNNFFQKRSERPRFKKKGRKESFRFPQGFKLDQANSRIYLPKLGWIRYRNSRNVLDTVKNVTVSQTCGKWFVSIQTELDVEPPAHPATSIIGIDVGIARFATLSDGSHIEPLNTFRKHQARLARTQRTMSRKKRFSKNWKKAKARVQRIHTRIANVRRDFLHKATTTICKTHAIVCIEDLQVRNMSKSAAGSSEAPGRNVRAKSGLNKSILDQGWFEFRRQLEYKQTWLGGEVLAVPPQNISRICPACGHVSAENRQTQSRFACVECGYENNADLVGAINVLERGHRLLACGGMAQLGRPMKQEPAEASQLAFS